MAVLGTNAVLGRGGRGPNRSNGSGRRRSPLPRIEVLIAAERASGTSALP